MRNKLHKLICAVFILLCLLICTVIYWLYLHNEDDNHFECYSLVTFPKASPVGNLTLLTHFILNQNNQGVITFTGENDNPESRFLVSREIHFDYQWLINGRLDLTNINIVINQSDTIDNDVFKMNVFDFQRSTIHMIIYRFKNSYVLGSLSAPISICVDKDSML